MRHVSPAAALAVAAAVLLAACGRSPAETATAATIPATPTAAPAADPAVGPAESISGTVAETLDAGNYTYVRLTTASGDVWAATSRFTVSVGDRVTVPVETPMTNFHSATLNRDFPTIYFASHIAREGDPAPVVEPAQAPMAGHGTPKPKAPISNEPVAAAPGGTTVAGVWADSAKLAGKPVTVRGRVVKYNAGILGVNWVHVQDGSGKADDRTNDLTITTMDACAVGDIVTATGTLALNKDFGAGYTYAVILEQATLRKQ